MYYWKNEIHQSMSDAEIGELMNVVRTTVYRHRTSTLEELRKMMEEE